MSTVGHLSIESKVLFCGGYNEFRDRFKKIVDDTSDIGWGFHDCLGNLYEEYFL